MESAGRVLKDGLRRFARGSDREAPCFKGVHVFLDRIGKFPGSCGERQTYSLDWTMKLPVAQGIGVSVDPIEKPLGYRGERQAYSLDWTMKLPGV